MNYQASEKSSHMATSECIDDERHPRCPRQSEIISIALVVRVLVRV